MKLNTRPAPIHSHEGGRAKRINPEQQLRRSVMACLLWEDEFYEDGDTIARRIVNSIRNVDRDALVTIAEYARSELNLRHVPLLIASAMCQCLKHSHHAEDAVAGVIQRADELAEIVAIHCRLNGVGPDEAKKVLGGQMKRGLARAFPRFDAYQLAKYNRPGAITLRDVLFMCHAKPRNPEQDATWKQLIDGSLQPPDTWEVALSRGDDKKAAFTRLLTTGKLGYLALLRNLRNMLEAGVDRDMITDAIVARKGAQRVLPFRYVAAARAVPQLEPALDNALLAAVTETKDLSGKTVVLVDVSGSMEAPLSAKSDMTRLDAAATLASVLNCDRRVFTFSAGNVRHCYGEWDGGKITVEVPPRIGMAGIDAIANSQFHGGTMLGQAVKEVNAIPHDRLIVITDEQSSDPVPDPVAKHAYLINVASNQNGIGYGRWTHIDGFSESIIRYIYAAEEALS